MDSTRIFKHALAISLVASLASVASASPLPCVQRAINWKNSASNHVVQATVVANHDQGVVAFAQHPVVPYVCGSPYHTCLAGDPRTALLSSPRDNGQPFPLSGAIPLTLESLYLDSAYPDRIRSGSTTYDFYASCGTGTAANQLIGNDQWGNHWTISFQLNPSPVLP